MKKFFRVLTVAQLAFQAYNYYMEHKRNQEVKEMSKKLEKISH
ncbi:hypothetical protein LX97_01793 [Nonlabens dokdonensis]|uniref:Uncharacterized protein n=2 Tax=Nonlabens dokdonensis TaxID=328515 RepID=L7WDS9_NONDD|nr:hypothetical protein [Nonlabens dokdonensis]AGC77053.1 hypothetical protein DDD_1926 [Nonlabens dokdonensis DSW-6]PZX41014.1 hypothetical protein LX97_01793 [Nonlabens dokdonensis]